MVFSSRLIRLCDIDERSPRLGIINISSQLGFVGFERFSAYCASKGAIIQLTKAMALEYAKDGIRVNCVCPGAIDTPMVDRELAFFGDPAETRRKIIMDHPIGRIGRPEEVGESLAVAGDEAGERRLDET